MGHIDIADIVVINPDIAFLQGLQPLDKPGKRALARTGAAHDAQHAARRAVEADIREGGGAVLGIAKGEVTAADGPVDAGQHAARAAVFRRFVHNLGQHTHGDARFLILLDKPGNLHQGARNAGGVHVEGHQRAHGHGVVKNLVYAPPNDGQGHALLHDLHKRADGYGHFAHTETHARGHSGAIVPAATAQGLQRKRFNRRHGPDIFHQKGLALAFSGVEILQALTEGPHGQKDDQSRKAGKKQHQHGQPPAVRKQDGQHHKERDAVQHGAEQTARKKFTNFFRLLHMFDEHAGRGALKKGQGHAGEMLKSADGQAQVNNA